MKCPVCGSEKMSKVRWNREAGDVMYRYRECTKCGARYRTVETTDKIYSDVKGEHGYASKRTDR